MSRKRLLIAGLALFALALPVFAQSEQSTQPNKSRNLFFSSQ